MLSVLSFIIVCCDVISVLVYVYIVVSLPVRKRSTFLTFPKNTRNPKSARTVQMERARTRESAKRQMQRVDAMTRDRRQISMVQLVVAALMTWTTMLEMRHMMMGMKFKPLAWA